MRPTRSALRVLGRVRALGSVAAVAAVVATGAGCTAQQAIDRAALVNDLAARLDHAGQLTYTADYQLPHGELASIAQAQHPLRVAYTFPGGKLVVTPEAITDCRVAGGAMTCTVNPPPSPGTDSTIGLITAVSGGTDGATGKAGVVVPALVVGLLSAASLDSNAVIAQHDTTIAGEHATCVEVSGVDNAVASAFSACITVSGILGSFKGTVNGVGVEISMTGLRDTVADNAFDPPAGAKIVDRRPGRK
jgi:hypothetical protein